MEHVGKGGYGRASVTNDDERSSQTKHPQRILKIHDFVIG